MKKKMYTLLVFILCVTMVFTSCGTGGTSSNSSDSSDTAYTATQSGQGADKEVTVDEDDVKLETNIVSGDPSEVGPKSLKETVKDTVKGIFGKGSDETDSSDDAQDVQTGDNTSSVTTVSTDSKNADKTSASDATVDASSIIGAAIESKLESEEKQKEIEKASKSNVSSASDVAGYDENGDPEVPYDELSEEAFEDPDVKYADNAILIKFDKTFGGKLTKGLKKAGIGKLEYIFGTSEYSWYTGYILKSANLAETMENVRDMDNVITAEYNYVSEATADTIDDCNTVGESECFDNLFKWNPRTSEQWALKSCGIQGAWRILEKNGINPGGDSSVVVAVIDTGVDYTHKDLKANMWTNSKEIAGDGVDNDGNGYVDDVYGVDITTSKGSGMDDEGHGTHVAGIIAASNNKEGIVGIAYNTKVMAIKAGDASGYFLQNNVVKAINYAYQNGADVINMSFGGSQVSIAVKDALTTAYTRCVLVASAGNDGSPNERSDYYYASPNYPAAFSFVLGVMSVDSYHRESGFSNWDTTLFNSVEYEVYAPGEQILSTLPGDRYARLSGTSMAAPVVAAEAALLRSLYSDTSQYPTKYIYGQIVGGAVDDVACANPSKHTVNGMLHNVPGAVNFTKAFTYVPKPDIGISDYTLFDTAGFSADTANVTAGCEEVNNGDGILDAGETIALGFTLRNRWGMSKNTKVHIDADSSTAGIEHPYVEFLNNDLDYGSIGTYSESDSGKIYTGDVWTGWQNPFYVKVSKDCPNEYSIKLNITVTYENGLNEYDKTVYKSEGQALFVVRRGVELPNIIDNDMTLTKDNYYIIPNATTIMEGATVTVEPGTQIQFWCSDAEDAYADVYIAYLRVEGKFICNGTEDEPVEIFPSEWMGNYIVQIYDNQNGYTELNYTNVTNPYLTNNGTSYSSVGIDVADNCKFTQNYKELYYRYLNDGKVATNIKLTFIDIENANNCLFYKLGGEYSHTYASLFGKFKECAFVDCCARSNGAYSNAGNFLDCVFYGNNNYDEGSNGGVSSMTVNITGNANVLELENSVYDYDNGVLYVAGKPNTSETFKAWTGIEYATISNKDEAKFIAENLGTSHYYQIANAILEDDGTLHFENGEVIPKEMYSSTNNINKRENRIVFRTTYCDFDSYGTEYALYQTDIPIYMTDIKLDKYLVDLDMESTYQIMAEVTPANARPSGLIYESENESVATVDANGLVTPVAIGSTTIKVYSPDKAIYTYITVNVRSVTLPESIEFTEDELSLQVGESKSLSVTLTPRYSTKWEFTYESSDTDVATVDEDGLVTAHSTGDAVITATGYGDIRDTITIHCLLDATGLTFKENVYVTNIEKDDGHDFYPTLNPAGTTDTILEWESASPDICYVDEEGNLKKLKEGIAELKATVKGTDYSATIQIAITDEIVSSGVKKTSYNGTTFYVLLDNGTLWTWGGNVKTIKKCTFDGVNFIDDFIYTWNGYDMYILDDDGDLWGYNEYSDGSYTSASKVLSNIQSLSDWTYGRSFSNYAITTDGGVWGWGYNDYGQLGDGTINVNGSSIPVQMNIDVPVEKVVAGGQSYNNAAVLVLGKTGDLYILGGKDKLTTPKLFLDGVVDIDASKEGAYYIIEKENACYYMYEYRYDLMTLGEKNQNEKYDADYSVYIENGKVYIKGRNSYGQLGNGDTSANENGYYQMQGIDNAVDVQFFTDNVMVECADGSIYMLGKGTNYELGNGNAENSSTPVKLNFGLDSLITPISLEGWNHDETEDESENLTLSENKIILDFDGAVSSSSKYGSISLKDSAGNACMLVKELDLDKLYITPRTALANGETYTLTLPAGALSNYFQETNSAITITFTYTGTSEEEPTDGDAEQQPADTSESQSSGEEAGGDTQQQSGDTSGGDVQTPSESGGEQTPAGGTENVDNSSSKGSDTPATEQADTNKSQGSSGTEQSNQTPDTNSTGDATSGTGTDGQSQDTTGGDVQTPSESGGEQTPAEGTGTDGQTQGTTGGDVVTPAEGGTETGSTQGTENTNETTPSTEGGTETGGTTGTEQTPTTETTTPDPNEPPIPDDFAYDVVNEVVIDQEKMAARTYPTIESIMAEWNQYVKDGLNTLFKGNAILNRLIDDDVTKWLRITAAESSTYQKISLGGNYWGTISEFLINKQILDYNDYQTLGDINEGKYLTEAPSDVWPFVVDAYVMVDGQKVDTVGNQEVTFVVEFNRDMDTLIPLSVQFGSSYPYGDYEVSGSYVSDRRWEGTITLDTLIENGYQKLSISNGKAAGTSMKLFNDWGRFQFKIDTTAAQALIMQAEPTSTGIKLTWSQDDFDTLAGYNIYRSTKEDGQYTRLNKSIIAADTKEWFDDTVIPGEQYYYNFTVVESDMTESEPSGKITVRAYDTMAPNLYHSPVYQAFTGSKLMISATVTDNVEVDTVTLYYRVKGETAWKSVNMTHLNDKYSAAIPAADVTTAGIEYYIDAFDGTKNHTYKGSEAEPYEVTVSLAVDENAKGDVDGNGVIEVKDAMMLLMAVNDRLNLDAEQFARADIDGDETLTAAEALRILKYVNGTITSIVA